MEIMEIREAVLADEEAVTRLWAILIEQYQKEAKPEILKRAFRYAVHNPRKIKVYVALANGEIAGTASLHLGHYSTWNDNFYGHVEDLIIDPRYRGRGLAYRLLRKIIEVAREENLARLELNTKNNNRAARELYEKAGFSTSSIVYDLTFK